MSKERFNMENMRFHYRNIWPKFVKYLGLARIFDQNRGFFPREVIPNFKKAI